MSEIERLTAEQLGEYDEFERSDYPDNAAVGVHARELRILLATARRERQQAERIEVLGAVKDENAHSILELMRGYAEQQRDGVRALAIEEAARALRDQLQADRCFFTDHDGELRRYDDPYVGPIVTTCGPQLDALTAALAIPSGEHRSEPAAPQPCEDGHTWTNTFGEDWTPDAGMLCDCRQKAWGARSSAMPQPENKEQ